MQEKSKIIKDKALKITEKLKKLYPNAKCALEWGDADPWRLLCMARLSAQCTDKRVNEVSKSLFEVYPDVYSMAQCDINRLESMIYSCGLYKTKAKSLREMSNQLIEKYNGIVPNTMEELLCLSGVGRKIANLMIGDVFGDAAVVCDTHCIRITARLGLINDKCKPETPEKTEAILKELILPSEQSDFCHRIVMLGREICTARSPLCSECELRELCSAYESNKGK